MGQNRRGSNVIDDAGIDAIFSVAKCQTALKERMKAALQTEDIGQVMLCARKLTGLDAVSNREVENSLIAYLNSPSTGAALATA